MEQAPLENKKLNWLESLATESWQVEMIASGLAIYGSLALGDILDTMAMHSQAHLTDAALDVMGFGVLYLYMAQALMTVCFISHLCLRIIWVGFLGLASVYPDGIKATNSAYSDHFLAKLKAEFSDVSGYTLKLDHLCSRVFANFCSIALMMIAFAFWILLLIGISQAIHIYFGIEITKLLMQLVTAFVFVMATLGFLLNSKLLRDTTIGKKYGYGFYVSYLKPILQFTYRPINYTTWIQRTNQTRSEYLRGFFVMVVPILILGGYRGEKATSNFTSKRFMRMNAIAVNADANNYFDQVDSEVLIKPLIQSRNVRDNNLNLFIPQLYREKDHMEALCGKLEEDNEGEYLENSQREARYFEDCASSYYSVSLDSSSQIKVKFIYLKNEFNNQEGFSTILKIDSLSTGYHELKLHTAYKNEEGESAVRIIPFNYFTE